MASNASSHFYPTVPSSVSAAIMEFYLNGAVTNVSQDTGTPANSRPLPVRYLDSTGATVDLATEATLGVIDGSTQAIATDAAAINVSTASIDSKIPALGQALMAASLPVVIASDQSAVPVSVGSLPLPTGAATEATLLSIDGKTPALVSGRVPVDGSGVTQPISAAALPLPTGASTEATLAAMSAKLPAALGQLAMAASVSVAIASDQSTLPVSLASVPLPTGAATEATLAALSAKFGPLGQAAMAASSPVVLSSDQSAIPISNLPATADTNLGAPGASTVRVAAMLGVGSAAASSSNPVPVSTSPGRSVVTTVRNDYGSVNVTTGAWVQLIASTGSVINRLSIFDSSGQTLEIGTGAAASETRLILVFPGGNGSEDVTIPAATRVSIKAVSANATSGELSMNCYS